MHAIALFCLAAGTAPLASQGPGARHGHELVHHDLSGETVLFGGFGEDGTALGDTWIWNGASWRKGPEAGPTPRRWPAMAYDSRRAVLLLFGGREGTGRQGRSLGDTWSWDGRSWRRLDVAGPSGRDHHRMVYDRRRERIVLFGGWDGEKVLGDTWEWDGKAWHRIAEDGPAPRTAFAMAYDETWGDTIVQGGNALDRYYGDTWTWNGAQWRRRATEGPGARAFQAAAYDLKSRQVLLFGGRGADRQGSRKTWAWNGRSWRVMDESGPLQEGVYAMAYDRVGYAAMFHGGGDFRDSRWSLRNRTWLFRDGRWAPAGGD